MVDSWPPHGYTKPKEYNRNETHVLLVMLVVTAGVVVVAGEKAAEGGSVYVDWWFNFAAQTAVSSSPILSVGLAMLVAAVGFVAIHKVIIVPVHEAIHYLLGWLLDMSPKFRYDDGFIGQNPAVVALSTDIPVWKNLVMLTGPFVLIGIASVTVAFLTEGLLAGVAAVIFMTNSVGSAQDLYHHVRLVQMNPKTRFANFEENGEIRTEYAVPQD